MRRALVLALVALAGCDVAIRIDPEGYRCDQGVCPQGFTCVDDVCRRPSTDLCQGVVCSSPAAPACLDANTQATWSLPGTCSAATGQCSYVQSTVPCALGCAAGRCVSQDPCATVSCTTPPDTACLSPSVLRTWSNPGVCDAGACLYAPTDTTCSSVCTAGACLTPALTFTQTGPRVRFAVTALDTAPGAGGDNVVAVGNGGQVARWNGTAWSTVAAPTSADLNAVSFVTPSLAVIVGKARTVWALRTSTGTLTALPSVPGPAAANLVTVSGRGENNVLIADDSGGWLKLGSGGTWTNGSFPAADGPFKMKSAYLDESGRERVGGLCGPTGSAYSCIAYRNSATGVSWAVDLDVDSEMVNAVGASFDVALAGGSDALLGRASGDLVRHNNSGSFTVQATSPAIEGSSVVGVTGVPASSGTRPVYVLTSRGTGTSGLYRLTKQLSGTVTAEGPLVETYLDRESLSPNEATGVVVAETKTGAGVNNIFRRSVVVHEALDLGEDFAGVTTDGALGLVLVSQFGDVAIRRASSSVYSFTRGPYVVVHAAEGRNGVGVLIAGKDGNSNDGALVRFAAGTFTPIATSATGVTFKAVCRVSDLEAYAVGTGGAIFSVSGTTATRMTSNASADLTAVDCPTAGQAVACGAGGVVLRLSGGAWTALPSPGSVALTSCRLVSGAVLAAGDAFFGRLDPGAPTWTSLPARPGLSHLVPRSLSDVYAASATGPSSSEIVRFDGSAWSTLLPVAEVLGGGVQIGARVVFGGSDGAILEGR